MLYCTLWTILLNNVVMHLVNNIHDYVVLHLVNNIHDYVILHLVNNIHDNVALHLADNIINNAVLHLVNNIHDNIALYPVNNIVDNIALHFRHTNYNETNRKRSLATEKTVSLHKSPATRSNRRNSKQQLIPLHWPTMHAILLACHISQFQLHNLVITSIVDRSKHSETRRGKSSRGYATKTTTTNQNSPWPLALLLCSASSCSSMVKSVDNPTRWPWSVYLRANSPPIKSLQLRFQLRTHFSRHTKCERTAQLRKMQYIGENDNVRKSCYTQKTVYQHSPSTNAQFPQCKREKTAQIHTEDGRRLIRCKMEEFLHTDHRAFSDNIDSTRQGKFKKTQSIIWNMISVNKLTLKSVDGNYGDWQRFKWLKVAPIWTVAFWSLLRWCERISIPDQGVVAVKFPASSNTATSHTILAPWLYERDLLSHGNDTSINMGDLAQPVYRIILQHAAVGSCRRFFRVVQATKWIIPSLDPRTT